MSHNSLPLTIPFLVACLGIASFAGMDAMMKSLSISLGVYNAMLWRTMIALAIAATLFVAGRNPWPPLSSIKIHVWRGLVTSLMALLFFWGLVLIPIAEAIALTFIAPLIALYLAAALLKEPVGRRAVIASLIGFVGGIIIISGKLGAENSEQMGLGIAAILVSAVIYAYNLILQRQQALIARPMEIALFQNLTVVTVFLLFAPLLAVIPSSSMLPSLSITAVLGLVSLMMLSWAYARAPARILIPVEYTAFAWAALFGWIFYGETVTTTTLLGTILIVTGCLAAARGDTVEHVETTAV